MSEDLSREHTDLQAEASALRQLATQLVVELRIARQDAYGTDHASTADIFDVAASVLDNRRAGQPLLEEIARLRAALKQCAQMKTIKGARAIVTDTLGAAHGGAATCPQRTKE